VFVLCLARSLSPVTHLDAHDGTILYQIPASEFTVKVVSEIVHVTLSKDGWVGFQAMGKSAPSMATPKSGCLKSAVVVYTAADLKDTATGRANIVKLFGTMKAAFEAQHFNITDDSGMAKLSKSESSISCNHHSYVFIVMYSSMVSYVFVTVCFFL
jgi:hypothetical protein